MFIANRRRLTNGAGALWFTNARGSFVIVGLHNR